MKPKQQLPISSFTELKKKSIKNCLKNSGNFFGPWILQFLTTMIFIIKYIRMNRNSKLQNKNQKHSQKSQLKCYYDSSLRDYSESPFTHQEPSNSC